MPVPPGMQQGRSEHPKVQRAYLRVDRSAAQDALFLSRSLDQCVVFALTRSMRRPGACRRLDPGQQQLIAPVCFCAANGISPREPRTNGNSEFGARTGVMRMEFYGNDDGDEGRAC